MWTSSGHLRLLKKFKAWITHFSTGDENFAGGAKLALTRAVELCNAWETSREQVTEMTAKTEEVQKISEQRQQCRFRSHTSPAQDKHFAKQIDCKFCGKTDRIAQRLAKFARSARKRTTLLPSASRRSTLWKKTMTCPRRKTTLSCIASKQTQVAGWLLYWQ